MEFCEWNESVSEWKIPLFLFFYEQTTPRSKQQKYEEILTTNQVLERLSEAEKKKN